jgi:hypothetical protein
LIFDQYLDPDNAGSKVTTRKYVGQFAIFANDPMVKNKSKVMDMTAGLKYIVDDLTEILDVLNGGSIKKKSNTALKPYAGLAVQGSTISYSGDFALENTKMSILPAINLGLDLYPNSLIRKYKIRFNVGFSAAKYETKKQESTNNYRHEFNQYTISFSPQAILNFYNSKKLKVNAGVGLMLNYSFYPTNKYTITSNFYGIENTHNFNYELSSFWFTLPIRAGVTLNDKIDLFAQYCPSFMSSMSDRLGYSMKTSNIQLGVNFCF